MFYHPLQPALLLENVVFFTNLDKILEQRGVIHTKMLAKPNVLLSAGDGKRGVLGFFVS